MWKTVAIIIAAGILGCGMLYGQQYEATPLQPAPAFRTFLVGEFSLGGIWQIGTFSTQCQCQFDNGIGTRWELRGGYQMQYQERWVITVAAGISRWRWRAAYREYEYLPYTHPVTQEEEVANVLVRNDAEGALQGLSITLAGGLYPFGKVLYVAIGPQLYWWLSSRRQHWQTLENPVVRTASGQEVWVQWENGAMKQRIEDGAFTGLRSFALHIAGRIGVEIPLGAQWWVQAGIEWGYPLLSLTRENFRLLPFVGWVGMRYAM